MKLEENMYVRTKYGITQYREYEINNCGLLSKIICMPVKSCNEGIFANTEDIVKASHNIIDLIEVGDYVNGNKIIKISTDHCGRNILIYGYDFGDGQVAITIYEDEIKSIVTKEQFEQMQYKVGD